MMAKYEIEIEGVPEGYEPVRFGIPRNESCIAPDGSVSECMGNWIHPRLIVRKKQTVKPWTFETAPEVIKVRSVKGGRDVLWLLESGFLRRRTNNAYTFEEVLSLFVQLDGSPCGEVVQ